ncbi:transcriptional regulator [Pseudonocardia acaciae]|uniref:transcriptional regulator n=1 Tax=Pseudonocardia acaciae TaxID=551276 RepID=UPI00056552E8|nr:transcriptional regulator [Pseudonocardia acaciae]
MNQPEGPLRAARIARGWSQSRAANELMALAAERGVTVAAPASLKTQLSRWENQHAIPEEHYRALLRELYGSTDAELGLPEAAAEAEPAMDDTDALRARLQASAALDDSSVELLHAQLDTTRRLDDRLGAAASAGSVRAQLAYLEEALHHAVRPHLRRRLAWLVAEASTLAGRLALDQARPSVAWHDHETAKAAAREADSAVLLGYALIEQASVLIDVGEHEVALSSVEQAIALAAADASTPARAWFEACRGEALAVNGAADEARAAYRHSERLLGEGPGRVDAQVPPIPIAVFDMDALHRHRGHAHQVLHEDEAAIADLELALRAGGGSARDVANAHVDLARAHGAVGHSGAAARHARSARDIAARIGSLRVPARLDRAGRSAGDELVSADARPSSSAV